MFDCYCDYDPPEFFSRAQPKARKQHRCSECVGKIEPGETYEYVCGKWDGSFSEIKTCERCYDIRQWVANNIPCFCWAYGSMIDDARETVDEAYWHAPAEMIGIRFGLLRRIVKRDRFNQARVAPASPRDGGQT